MPADSIYGLLHRQCFELFPDELFADLFTRVGRRSVPPMIVAVVVVLQRLEGCSDREAVASPPATSDAIYPPAMSVLGEHVRAQRLRHGVSQRSLAIRAGTTQAAISRIERGLESPSFERFTQLLLVLGEQPVLTVMPLELDVDPADLAYGRRLTPQQRLAESASWNLVTTQLEIAAAKARAGGSR